MINGYKIIFSRNNGLSLFEIFTKWFYKGNTNNFLGHIDSKCNILFTHLGRIGSVIAIRKFNFKQGDEILVPSYNCGSEIDPFIWYGMKPVIYRVNKKAKIDFYHLKENINSKTKAIYITHYFGWPQNLEIISEICKKSKLFLFEDCALSLFSVPQIGKIGDAAIYSFRKTLPLPEGAAIRFSEKYIRDDIITLKSPPLMVIIRYTIPYLIRWIVCIISKLPFFLKSVKYTLNFFQSNTNYQKNLNLPDMPADYYFNENYVDWRMSSFSKALLSEIDPGDIIKRRRNNYKAIETTIKETNGINPLFNHLPDLVCPLFFPVVSDDPHTWIRALNRAGITTSIWWSGFHQGLEWDDFPDAVWLKKHLFCLPVHQFMSDEDVEYVKKVLVEIGKGL